MSYSLYFPTFEKAVEAAEVVEAAKRYRELCLIQKACLEAYGDPDRYNWTDRHRWLEYSFDAVHDALKALQDAAQVSPIHSEPQHPGALAVRIY